jgi:hypothetical protein
MKKFFSFVWIYLRSLGKAVGNLCIRYPLALAATVVLVIAAIFMLVSGKTFQIGGILESLWGKKKENVRGVPPEERKKDDGTPILPGESDKQGFVQAPVTTKIADPGIFSNPSTVTVVHPDKGKIVIDLPTGVKNKDVQEVVEVKPNIYEVRNKDTGVKPADLNNLIGKLGG